MKRVSVRGGFSDRNAIKPENAQIQLKDFDYRTRIQLQNMVCRFYDFVYDGQVYGARDCIQEFCRFVLGTVFSEVIGPRELYDDSQVFGMLRETILNASYDDVLTLIEAIIQYWDEFLKETKGRKYYDKYSEEYTSQSIFEAVNECFEKEYVGYRFVDGIIVPISDSHEVETIVSAMNNENTMVYEHIAKANKLLADREHPDYENSIKESISAVEAICEVLTNTKGKEATLSAMLKKLEDKGIVIHKGLKSAFNILYGYTSDANGIRHAGDIGGPSSTFEEAKFMLVACCAFINYLTALSAD